MLLLMLLYSTLLHFTLLCYMIQVNEESGLVFIFQEWAPGKHTHTLSFFTNTLLRLTVDSSIILNCSTCYLLLIIPCHAMPRNCSATNYNLIYLLQHCNDNFFFSLVFYLHVYPALSSFCLFFHTYFYSYSYSCTFLHPRGICGSFIEAFRTL